jgi:S-adenosylmethionine hydrolase
VGKPLAYLNSLMQLSFALNQGSMAEKFNIGSGPDWTAEIAWGDYLY